MLQVNLVQVIFSFLTCGIILLGGLFNTFEDQIPIYFRETFRYGKFAYSGKASIIKSFKIPKSFFKHFYVYSGVLSIGITLLMLSIPLLNFDVPDLLYQFLDLSCGINRRVNVTSASSLLAMVLLTVHLCRRFYETHFVSVFGKKSQMDLFQYLLAFIHYTGVVIAVLAETSGFVSRVTSASSLLAMVLLTVQCCRRFYETHFVSVFGKNGQMDLSQYLIGYIHYTGSVIAILAETSGFVSRGGRFSLRLTDLTNVDFFATLLFMWASWHQYKAAVILANLRKNKKGVVVTQDHKLPYGDWFNYVTSPHLLAEILIYFSLTIILWNNITWLYIFAWVLTNQVEIALLNHWWYQDTFENYPKERKVIIPLVY